MTTTQEYFIQQKQFEHFVKEFVEGNEQPRQEDIDQFIKEIKVLERFSVDRKRFFALFDHSKFYPAYLSANVEKEGGYSVDYILNQGLFFLFQRIHWKQLSLGYKVINWAGRYTKLIERRSQATHVEVCCCGLKFKDKWNKWRTVVLKQKPLINANNGTTVLSFIEAEEITSIYKGDFVWYRPSCTIDGRQITRAYFSNGTKKEYPDILSQREIEILQLAAQQKSNQEISELLSISKNTVERHRKNMIAKVGVTDMTALLRIGQLVNLI